MIDLRSDTVTQPTEAMRKAMMTAVVGDDVYDDDPTIRELERFVADLLKKEAALFVPSGTFGNQLCLMTHTKRGDEVIVGHDSHIMAHEVGASAVIAGVQLRQIESSGGRFDIDTLKGYIREEDIHYPDTGLICMEQAHGDGSVMPIDHMKKIYDLAKEHDIPVHLDGARLFNAAAALDVKACELAKYTDSLTFCLSKGLCAPVGSMVVGSKDFIKRAKKYRKLMGGGLRQAGFLAAAGLIALNEMVDRLKDDHDLAKYMASKLEEFSNIEVIKDRLDINMVFFKMTGVDEEQFISDMYDKDIKINGTEDGEWRFVTNHDVTKEHVDYTIETMKALI
ncbi:low-specificity L-threonine aldolase [Acidaminobacter sp. JC074]|uniref:low-specificity L-threonine aldolase n=1 Tax=Acidaminobacter sp. JC074 TaxID=2530199 RepID=UPI001F0FE316|nr:low-specificity L-threonine aldolase [Acidaminobacter sp. JC074]MCH4889494.1 low-specificity L-threonine aldolase [Acidaminobacter sp. JC074]